MRIELVDGSGERMTARLRREDVEHLELTPGEIVWATPEVSRTVLTPAVSTPAGAGAES